jgi:hypothetical protein
MNLIYVAWTRAELELHLFFPKAPLCGQKPRDPGRLALLEQMGVADDEVRFGPEPKAPAAPAWAPRPPARGRGGAGGGPGGLRGDRAAFVLGHAAYGLRNSVRDLRDSLSFTEKKRGPGRPRPPWRSCAGWIWPIPAPLLPPPGPPWPARNARPRRPG